MKPTAPRTHTSGLRRDIDILEALAAHSGLTVTRLAELTGRDKAQVSRVLATLTDAGLVERSADDGRHRLGHRLYALAARTAEAHLAAAALPRLRHLTLALDETTHLCVLRGGDVLTLLSAMPGQAFSGLGWQGTSVPARQSTSGRVLLSDHDDDALAEWCARHPPHPADPGAPHDFTSAVHRARDDGLAQDGGSAGTGLLSVSAPVRDLFGHVVAALNVAAPGARPRARTSDVSAALLRTCEELSSSLGAPAVPAADG